jgi:hypothetical protein
MEQHVRKHALAQAAFQETREALMRPDNLTMLVAARRWLRENAAKGGSMRTIFSFGLLHLMGPEVGRMTHGVVVAAALAEGCKIERSGPDKRAAWIDIPLSDEAWERYSQLDAWLRGEKER